MTKKPIAIIGGSGFAHLLQGARDKVATPYGEVPFLATSLGGRDVIAIKRHGIEGHNTPPHRVNYRANVKAAEILGVEGIITTHATGIVNPHGFKPGQIAFPHAFVPHQLTLECGPVTYYIDEVHHSDMSTPRDERFYQTLVQAANILGLDILTMAILITVPGPRYETAAEIELFGRWGMDLVGMTHAYEAILAMELKLRIASIAICTNYGTGIVPDAKLEHAEVEAAMKIAGPKVYQIIEKTLELM